MQLMLTLLSIDPLLDGKNVHGNRGLPLASHDLRGPQGECRSRGSPGLSEMCLRTTCQGE